MYHFNSMPNYKKALDPTDIELLGDAGADKVAAALAVREGNTATPLFSLPHLAHSLGIHSLHVKDEGQRLGLGSFKALGGAYALMKLVQREASLRLNRDVSISELLTPAIRQIAETMVFACATDGNHGRSVAQGAQLVGAKTVIFVHAGVSQQRIDAIAAYAARMVRVNGNYDVSVTEASRVAKENGWIVLSDTSWPGYEEIPGLVMQGYTILAREALDALPHTPTHIFLQAGVGGFAAAIAGYMAIKLGEHRPHITVVEPERAACLYESAKDGRVHKIHESEPTIMAMLECYEPSVIAMRVLERVSDGFMTIDESIAPEVMKQLANPIGDDKPIISGESGGAGLAGLMTALRDSIISKRIHLCPDARVLVINTEGATDPVLYEQIVGRAPQKVLEGVAA